MPQGEDATELSELYHSKEDTACTLDVRNHQERAQP